MPSTCPGCAVHFFYSIASLSGAHGEWKGFALISVLSRDCSLAIYSFKNLLVQLLVALDWNMLFWQTSWELTNSCMYTLSTYNMSFREYLWLNIGASMLLLLQQPYQSTLLNKQVQKEDNIFLYIPGIWNKFRKCFFVKKRVNKQNFHYKIYFFFARRFGSNIYNIVRWVHLHFFLHNSMVATLCLHFPPVICLCSTHHFPWSCCQMMGFSKSKEIWDSLLSKWNGVAWLIVAKEQGKKWTLLK